MTKAKVFKIEHDKVPSGNNEGEDDGNISRFMD